MSKKHFEMIAGNIKYLTDMVDAGETNDMSDDMIIGYSAALKQLAENVSFDFQSIGQAVWVKCAGSDAWVSGVITGFTGKHIRVLNEVRGIEGLYAPQNVEIK